MYRNAHILNFALNFVLCSMLIQYCFMLILEKPLYSENFDLENMITPVNADLYECLLIQAEYPANKIKYLVVGFMNGFDIGYRGPSNVKRKARNLKFTIGDEVILWNKRMKEVQLKRFAGPYKNIPFEHYIQSPVGLVPKDNGASTRLIFHLSYPRSGSSLNSETPKELCTVQYPDFCEAIRLCLQEGKNCAIAKSDMKSAFCNLGILPSQYYLLVMYAVSPFDGQVYYFVDKCLPFGASIL